MQTGKNSQVFHLIKQPVKLSLIKSRSLVKLSARNIPSNEKGWIIWFLQRSQVWLIKLTLQYTQTLMEMRPPEWDVVTSYSTMALMQEWGYTVVNSSKHCWDNSSHLSFHMLISHHLLGSEVLRPWQLLTCLDSAAAVCYCAVLSALYFFACSGNTDDFSEVYIWTAC